jgi:deoxyribonuclease-4
MTYFGPAGNSESFYEQGHKRTWEAFAWLKDMNLDAYEYQFGRGVRIKRDTAEKIGDEAAGNGILMSVHAPYYINLAGTDKKKLEKSIIHIEKSIKAARWMKAKRVVMHPGGLGGDTRNRAIARALEVYENTVLPIDSERMVSPELMGKINQLGNMDEIIAFCRLDDGIIPTIDFGHLNARTVGTLDSAEAFEQVVEKVADGIGWDRTRRLHVHFSRIEYTQKGGEKKHWTLEDKEYGPDFKDFVPVLFKYDMHPVIICESSGTMAEDAKKMKEIYLNETDGH